MRFRVVQRRYVIAFSEIVEQSQQLFGFDDRKRSKNENSSMVGSFIIVFGRVRTRKFRFETTAKHRKSIFARLKIK